MKTIFAFLLFLVIGNTIADSATITWTNTSGGNWSGATNWSPNQVPGSSDDAVITTNGSYTVTLDTSPTVNSLTLGGSSGQQTLTTSNNTLTLNNASVVNTNGVLALNGGTLSGAGLFTINGQLNWTNGSIAPGSILMLATNGTLLLAGGNNGDYQMYGILTNAGTIDLISGTLDLREGCFGGQGQMINLPGAVMNLTAGTSISTGCGGTGELLVNEGTLQQTNGTGTSTINVPFDNVGLLDVQTGTFDISDGDTTNSAGVFRTESGATLAFVNNFTANSGVQFTGAGTNIITSGTFTLNGLVTISNLTLLGGMLAGTNGVMAGVLTWTSGSIAPGSILMLATNGTLLLAGGNNGDYQMYGILTNAGTIDLISGTLDLREGCFGGQGQMINLPGAVMNLTAGTSISTGCGGTGELLVNEGTLQQTNGTGTSTINVPFDNVGLLDVQTGTFDISDGDTTNSAGVFRTESGATLAFVNNFTANSGVQFTGAGTNIITSGTFTLNGLVTISNLTLLGGMLAGTNGVMAGVLTWTSGSIAPGSILMLATNGTLLLAGGNNGDYQMYGILTNAGTIDLISGTLDLREGCFGGQGQMINLPGAVMNLTAGTSISTGCGGTGELLVNEGTLQQTNGTGTSTINVPFDNVGLLDVQTGTLSLNGSYTLAGGTLNFGINSLTSYGIINLSGSPATLAGSVSANLNNGYVPATGNSFTVLTYGSYTGLFTNTTLPAVALWQTNYGPTSFTISVTSVSMLAFTTQPVGGVLTNKILAPVVVQVENPVGNPVATNGVPVTLSLNSGSGTLSGTLTQNTDPTGKATFSDLSFNHIGNKTLLASNPALAPATSVPFRIVPLFDVQWTGAGLQLGLYGTNSLGSTIIYASTNLVFWTPIYTNAPINGAIIFLDPASTNFSHRFYRTLQE